MECQAWVMYCRLSPGKGARRKDGEKLVPVGYWFENDKNIWDSIRSYYHKADLLEPAKCHGKIIATISAIDEPYFGGSSAMLRIDYKCDTCGCDNSWDQAHNVLPRDDESLSKFVTEAIENYIPKGEQ